MFWPGKKKSTNHSASAIPAESRPLVRELKWLLVGVLGLFLVLILASYFPQDPSFWYNASENVQVHNYGGRFGAWLSAMLLALFGFSAWWWTILLGLALSRSIRAARHPQEVRSLNWLNF